MDGSHFSDEMSDEVTIEQQRKEELAAMVPPSEGSVASGSSRRTEQWVEEICRERANEAEEEWPNSNVTNELAAEEGCSRAPPREKMSSRLQIMVDEDLTYSENTSGARPQGSGITRGNARVCAYGKHKKVRPPMINVGERQVEVPRKRSVAGSVASSQRSSVYKAAILEAQAETQRALAELASTRAGCNDQHRAIAENMRTLQTTMREGLQVSDQLRTAQNTQSARVDALGYRMGEMNDLLMARELRVETQINDLSNQMHTVLNAINIMRRERSLPRQAGATEGVPIADSMKATESSHRSQATKPELASVLKPSTSKSTTPETRTRDPVPIMAAVERKPARVQVRGPHDSSSMSQMTSSMVRSATRDQGVDPMSPIYLDTSTEVDLSCTKATLGSQTDGAAYATAPTMVSGTDSLYLTADWTAEDGMPSGAPCASSTRRKEDVTNLSVRATHGSDDGTDDVATKEGEAEVISPEQLRFTAAISKAMSKELAPLLAGRDLAQTKPSVYRGSKDGSIDGWILVMQRYLKRIQTKISAEDRAWSIIGHLEGEARNYIINKAESERDTPEKVFELLSSRFGAGGNRMQVRQTFQSRVQQEKEDWMQYLDALEGLRSQGFPQESIITKRYEILQRFMEGVRDPVLRRELAIVYASETFLTEPPTVESLRFTTRQLQRNRPRPTQPQQPYDPRLAMRSRPHPFAPLPPNKMVMPQGVLPPPAPPQNVPAPAVPSPARAPVGACFHWHGHFARECPNRDQARKPMTASEPEGVKVTTEDTTDGILEGHPGIYQCASCGLFDQAEVQCGEHSHAPKPSDELAYNRWAEVESAGIAAHTVPLEDDRVLMLHPAEPPAFHTPMTFTCGAKQVQTCLEPTTFDPQGRTLISIHLLLAAEQTRRPTLTLAKLWVELSILYKRNELPRPKEWYAPGESATLTTYSPVPVCASMDGVDMKFEACVVVDVFPPGICLGPQELKCYNINHQEPTGEARIDERASLVVSFMVPHAAPIPLRGLVDTGSGVSILTFSAFNRVAARTGTVLKPYQVDLYAANGKTIKTYGLAEHIHFQLGGYELETNFVVVDDAMGVEDFLLGRNFLRSYQVLVDLTSMKIVVRAPVKPVWHHAHAQVGDTSIATPVVLDSDLVLQPFERAVARAKLVTNTLEPLIFQSVALNASLSDTTLHNVVFLEDSVATVSETGTLFVSLINLTSNPQRMRCGVQLGTVVPVTVVYQAVPQCLDSPTTTRTKTDADDSRANFVHKIYSEVNLSTASELTSSSEFEFLSSTDPSEAGLSEREIRKRTDPELMAPIPGPESQLKAVKDLWGASACESLRNLLDEFDELFMKHKADIGRCTIAKHTVEVEPGAVPHREGARRMSPEKAERANQEVRNLLALGMIQPSLSPWASGIVMVKKKNGELRFCCDFRPLNEVTIKDAYPLPRIDESLARLGKAKIYTSIDLAWAFWQIPVRKADRHKTAFACELGLFEWRRMPFGMCNASATFQRSIARALRNIVNREGSMVMAYIDDIVIATETVEDHMVRLREVFECLREAGFKMRVAKCDFMKSEIKYLGRVVSAEGVKPDPKAVVKLRDWEIPRNKTEMQSFLGFANYYREFIPWHAKLVAPLHAVTGLNATFAWGPEQQTAFNEIKKALIEATALAQPDSEGEFVLDTDASAVAISGILHQWQGPPGERRLRPIVYGSKKLTTTQAKYGAPKLEMFAAYYFIVKNHSYLCPRKFTLRVDNQALSWLKTYSTDQALIGRWIMTLEKYHFRVEHRPRTQHRNADGLSKRTNEYRCREKQLAQQPAAGERWNFLSADEFDKLPVAPWFDLQGRVIPNHPELPAHLQNLEPKAPNQLLRVLRRTKRASRRDRQAKAFAAPLPPPPSLALQPHEDAYPDYPEDWIDVTDEAREDYLLPTHAVNVPSRTVYAIAGANPVALQGTPSGVRDSIMALKDINTELHEHAHTMHGIKDLILAQNRDVHVLALKKLVLNESIDHDVFPENVREFARNYYRQKKTLLFINKNGVLCVQYPPNQRPLHERPCMIVMPQLYQHEILFRAHDAMGHQGISKVVARIQERHTWPGIRRSVGRYVGQCLTCQQVRDKPGDVRFHLKNIQSGYFNELVQYDHLKICPSDSNNTGILVIIDHFSKFAEAVPCSHHDYDAVTTSRLLLQKWFARHGTPTRMQSDNAPNLTAEVSNEFLKAAHVTKVTSTASHPRTQGLVERQNRTLLTLLRVFCSRRMRDWDQCLDEVMGAYNSTRHATTGFSPYMLTRGVEKAIPLTFLYPEFAAKSFESHEAYVDHVLARQQEIHDLVRRNTHQAQLRQKLKYDRAIQARAYQVGELVWVFCRYVPQKGSPKLMRAWRGPHKVVQVFQDGRVYVLDTGQKVHFERLKPHHSGPLELATAHSDSGEVVVLMDPEPERSVDVVDDDKSLSSYKPEQLLSEASDASLPSRRRHWMDTRLRTKLRAGGSRPHYQQFDYSTSGTDDELSDAMLPIPPNPVDEDMVEPAAPPTTLDQSISPARVLPQLFSDHERVRSPSPQISSEEETSLPGTSASLLTNPSLTNFLSNYPIWPTAPPIPLKSASSDSNVQPDLPDAPETSPGAGTAPSFKRGRGRPPKAQKKRLIRAKARTRKKETPRNAETETAVQAETEAPRTAETLTEASATALRYQLRSKRQPRYRCGTCGLRDCVCLLAVNENRRVPIGARGVPPEERENLVYRLTVRAEKTYSAVERSGDYPVDTILEKLSLPGVAKAPCPRFKEWTSDGKGLEFTLPTVLPPVPSNIAFGPFNFEREPVQMVRCITADLLCDKYGVQVEPGGVYSPAPHWWLLVTAPRVEALVEPLNLLSCLESLRTLTTVDLILCFHIIDWYRGKMKFTWWLELIITCFATYPRIRLLDEWTHTFEIPLFPKAALGTLDAWVKAGSDNRAMPRSVWQDLAAIQGRTPHVCLPSDNGPGREIVYPGALYPNSAEHVSYDESDFLQAEGDIVLACPADLKTNSAALRYVLRECGMEDVFALRPKVGEILTIPPDVNPNPNQSIHLLIVRANQRAPLLTDDYLRCMTYLIQRLIDKGSTRVHLPILDPERPAFSLVNLYHTLTSMFEGTGIHVVLHSRVYVSILTIGLK